MCFNQDHQLQIVMLWSILFVHHLNVKPAPGIWDGVVSHACHRGLRQDADLADSLIVCHPTVTVWMGAHAGRWSFQGLVAKAKVTRLYHLHQLSLWLNVPQSRCWTCLALGPLVCRRKEGPMEIKIINNLTHLAFYLFLDRRYGTQHKPYFLVGIRICHLQMLRK